MEPTNNDKHEIGFVSVTDRHKYRHYCSRCLYGGKDKAKKLDEYPKPANTKCLMGSVGYYIFIEPIVNR
jgi:hypothetical protein